MGADSFIELYIIHDNRTEKHTGQQGEPCFHVGNDENTVDRETERVLPRSPAVEKRMNLFLHKLKSVPEPKWLASIILATNRQSRSITFKPGGDEIAHVHSQLGIIRPQSCHQAGHRRFDGARKRRQAYPVA